MNTNTSSWGKSKLVLLGSIMFLSSFFFGGQANAAFCFWTATGTPSVNFSSTTVWKDAGGTTCDPSANTATFQGASSTTNIVFDVSTTTQGIYIDSAYTGVITVTSSVTVTSTGAVFAQGGTAGVFNVASGGTLVVDSDVNVSSTASFLVDGTLKVGGNLIVTSTLLSTAGTVTFTSSTAQSISGPGNITFYALNVTSGANTVTLGSSVTSTGGITVASGNTFALGANNLVVSSSISNSGTITQSSAGTVTMNGTGNLGGTGNTTLFNLVINGTTTFSNTVTTTNILTINSGKVLNAGTSTIILTSTSIPFVVNGTFNYNSSTVVYSGVGGTYISPTSSYYNLTINSTDAGVTSLTASVYVYNVFTINGAFYGGSNDVRLYGNGTPFVNSGTFTPAYGAVTYLGTANVTPGTYYDLRSGNGGVTTLIGNVTSTHQFFVDASSTLSAGSALITLSGTSNVFLNWGTFTAGTSEMSLTNTVSSSFYNATFYKLTLGTGVYSFTTNNSNAATSTNTVTNNGTLILEDFDFFVTGDFTNNGTTTYSGTGKLKKAATGGLTATSYTSGTANGTGNTITITVTDSATNLLAASAETKTVSISANTYNDTETVTLTETGVATGIFSGTIPFNIVNASATNSKVDVSGNGTLTLAYSNDYGALTGSGVTALYTGSSFSFGSTNGVGGSSPSVSSVVTAVTITAGAQTTSQTITLNLSATNATQVAISEDPGFAGANWDTYAPTKPFTLSNGAGEKTIYVKFRSASGGVTSAYKVSITLKADYVAAPTAITAPIAVVTAVAQFEVTNPESKVVISPVKTLVYKPNSVVKYTYAYKNAAAKTVKVKIVRSVVDAKGKVITKVTGSASITKGKTYKFNANSPLSNKVAEGNYTVKVQVLDFKTGKLIDENSFAITVKKPLPPPTITSNNPDSKVVITGLKVDYKVGSAVKYTYSYKNESGKPLKIKIVRQVVDGNGKVISQVAGTSTLSKGTTFKFNATSALSKKLAVGTYTAKVQVLDAKNVVLDENGFDFIVKK